MSYKSENTVRKQQTPKAGRTILVKVFDKSTLECVDSYLGFLAKHYVEKTNSYFFTFATTVQSNTALEQLRTQFGSSISAKFAQYRIYFTMKGLSPETEYGAVKALHCNMINASGKCNVLYYKLYRKNDAYIGCGDITIDTKEGFDYLVETCKNYSLKNDSVDLSGVHYRYNKLPLEHPQ